MPDIRQLIADELYTVFLTWPGPRTHHHLCGDQMSMITHTTGERETDLTERMADAVVKLLNGTAEDDHVIRLTDAGFTIQHPLIERINSTLFDCTVHQQVSNFFNGGGGGPMPGDYRIVFNENGGWSFEPVKKQREEPSTP